MKIRILLVLALCLSGCATYSHTTPNGDTVRVTEFFQSTAIDSVQSTMSYTAGTNTYQRSTTISGLTNGVDPQTATIINTVVGAAVSAAAKVAKP